jgi:hypothetical protein
MRKGSPAPRTLLVLAAAMLALLLGYLGYRAVPGRLYSPTDALYWSISQFSGRVGNTPGGTPWQLDVGRFVALAVALFAAAAATAAALRDRWDTWWVRRFARGHAIVAGSGAGASATVEAFRAAGHRVVVIDVEPRSQAGIALWAGGARLVAGDATEPEIAMKARIDRARLLVVITGEDERNLNVLGAATAALSRRTRSGVRILVAIDDQRACRELALAAVASPGEITVEFFNPADLAALALLNAVTELDDRNITGPILIDGHGPIAIQAVVQLVRRALVDGRSQQILVSADRWPTWELELSRSEPWCLAAAEVHAADRDDAPAVAIVCGDRTDASALARGVELTRQLTAPVAIVAVRSMGAADGLRRAGLAAPTLRVVAVGIDAIAGDVIESSVTEILARARHEEYRRGAVERGETLDANPSLVSWERLPDALKESNRRFAESIGATIRALGGTLRPLAGAPTKLPIPAELLDQLARREHDRWSTALERDGWRPTEGPKDSAAKLHPLLVAWEELPESDREKDRDTIRGLPEMLALIGYELVVPESR